jgi:hypothetical protein
MNRLKILDKFTLEQIGWFAEAIHKYFQLASAERINKLILQVDSIDEALHLLMIHKNCELTLDAILYEWLQRKDEGK